MKGDLILNKKKARRCFKLIYEAYQKKTHLFQFVHASNGDAPQYRYIPKGVKKGSIKHQIFLFFANILTYHSQSEQGFQQCLAVYEKHPDFFSKKLWVINEKEIADALDKVGFIYPVATAKRWLKSGQALFLLYEGKPLKIFEGRQSIDEVMNLNLEKGLNVFPGLGPKLFSLLNIFYNELGLMKCIKGSFPVDIHVQAECMGMGIVEVQKEVIDSTPLAEFLRTHISQICEEEKFKPLDLSHALWFLGNRVCSPLCQKKQAQAEHLCPVFKFCKGRVSTKLYRTKGKWGLLYKKLPLFDD